LGNEAQITQANGLTAAPDVGSTLGIVQRTPGIAGGLEADATMINAAWLDAFGMRMEVVEMTLGLPPGSLLNYRNMPQYRELVSRCLEVKASMLVERANGDVDALFNSQIAPSTATLIQLRDNPYETGNVRLKAAQDFLNRAPDAPKMRKEVEERRTVISIPIGELRNMQQALLEEGTPEDLETVNLLENVDFTVNNGGGNGENGSEDEQRVEIVDY